MKIDAITYSQVRGIETKTAQHSFMDWAQAAAWLGAAIPNEELIRMFSDFEGDGEIMCVLQYDKGGM